ncbi:MAG: glycosyltransferase family A protein [Candidatus Roizmanbacteria bacterium]|nr:glycosyltransferase family A protein [Candidatus Roizmanbacteria bacterium]
MSPLISVLMPAYNAEKYIAEAIESILAQTFKDFELIISDDASTDKTWDIIKKYKDKDKRIFITRNSKNRYIAENRNVLVKLAKGKYIAWQDADDISVPVRLKKQSHFLEKNPQVGIVGGYLQFFDEKGTKSIRKYATSDKELRKNIFRFSPVAQPTAMIRSECFKKVGLYNPKYPPAEDIDMSFRIGKFYEFANLPQITLKYREHLDSATFNKLKKIELSTLEVRRENDGKNGYKLSYLDRLYNLLQYVSIFVLPGRIKIALFNAIRNSH